MSICIFPKEYYGNNLKLNVNRSYERETSEQENSKLLLLITFTSHIIYASHIWIYCTLPFKGLEFVRFIRHFDAAFI